MAPGSIGEHVMTIKDHDASLVTVVLAGINLLASKSRRQRFAREMNSDLTVEEMPPSIAPGAVTPGGEPRELLPTTMLSLYGGRILLDLADHVSSVAMPDPAFSDLPELAESVEAAIGLSDLGRQRPHAIGFLLHREYRQTEEVHASKYLADRLFTQRRFGFRKWKLIGCHARVAFVDRDRSDRRWTFSLKPASDDPTALSVYLHTDLRLDGHPLPDRVQTQEFLEEVWHRSLEFAAQLDMGA